MMGPCSAQYSTGKVFLYGGALGDMTSTIFTSLKNSTGKENPTIAVAISAAGSLEVGLEAYYIDEPGSWSYERLFTFYGFQPSVIRLAIDNYVEASTNQTQLGRENIDIVRQADVIFFNGGDQARHTRAWFKDDGSDSDILVAVRQRFAEGAIAAGTSAGTSIMSDPSYGEGYSYGYYFFNANLKSCSVGESLQDDREGTDSFRIDANGGYMKGFGFMQGGLADSHFDQRGRFARLVAAVRSTGNTFGVGVGEDTVVYINGEVATVHGTHGAWFVDLSEALFTNDTHMNVRNVRFSYLTEGDTINLTSRQVNSTKAPIPEGSGNARSSHDIFSNSEGINSATSLLNARPTIIGSISTSKERNPTAQVTFHRNRGEKGYQTAGMYTIDGMYFDIDTAQS